jgi:hypothetical protein
MDGSSLPVAPAACLSSTVRKILPAYRAACGLFVSGGVPVAQVRAAVDAIRQRVRAALDDGGPMRVKAILQELTDEIRIDGRDAIEPTFLVPAVRPPSGSMELAGLEPATFWLPARRSPN